MTTATENTGAEHFSAHIRVEGAAVRIDTSDLTVLATLLARLKAGVPSVAVAADEKQEVAASTTGKPPIKSSAKTVETKASSESAPPAGEPASPAPSPAASTVEPEKGVSYDDVKAVVNGLYAIKPQYAVDLLAQFGVKKGPDLDPTRWIEVVAAGKAKLAELQPVA